MHKANDAMRQRTAELQQRYRQILAETSDPAKREWAERELQRLERMEEGIPKTL